MKYAKFVTVFGVLGLMGAGSAVVLGSFGTISGTAEVEPALNFVEIQSEPDTGGEYVLLENNADVSIEVSNIGVSDADGNSDSLVSENSTSEVDSGDYLLITVESMKVSSYSDTNNFVHASTGDSGITSALVNSGEEIIAEVNEKEVNSFNYTGTGCGKPEAAVPERMDDSLCRSATFEVVN
jgi:hypothetical protein